ncbi:MAG: hypothetical protein FJ027_07920 [Candidatus Rokubacteria bacterium]|nr:hypothetical protein [Candidatus Rokubacteria bacterium]
MSLYVVDAVRSGNSSLREEAIQMADAWDAKTFGSLVRPLLDSPHIPSDMKRFLEGLRHQRNHLVHRYFKDKGAQLHTAEGRRTAEEELRRLLRDLRLCRDVVHSSAIDLATEVGVTEAMIAAEYDKMHARLIQR